MRAMRFDGNRERRTVHQAQTRTEYGKEFRPDAYKGVAPVITVEDLIQSVKRHIETLKEAGRFPVNIEVDVIEKFLPGAAYVLLCEKEPSKPLAMLFRLAGVVAFRVSNFIEERK